MHNFQHHSCSFPQLIIAKISMWSFSFLHKTVHKTHKHTQKDANLWRAVIISCSANIKYPLWWLRGKAEGAGLPHFNMNSVDVDSERCSAWTWIQSSQLSKVPLSLAFSHCCLTLDCWRAELFLWHKVIMSGGMEMSVLLRGWIKCVGAHHSTALPWQQLRGAHYFYHVPDPCLKGRPVKETYTSDSLFSEGV